MTRKVAILIGVVVAVGTLGSEIASAQTPRDNVEAQILATRVRLALANDNELRPFNFEVTAVGSGITLEGRVGTDDHVARAIAIAERMSGVSSVENRLRLLDGSAPEYGFQPDELALDEVDIDSLDPMMVLEMELEEEEEFQDDVSAEQEPVVVEIPAEPQIIYKVPDGYHMVEEGDTLLRISERYSITIRELRALNELSIAERPEPGELLRIREPE